MPSKLRWSATDEARNIANIRLCSLGEDFDEAYLLRRCDCEDVNDRHRAIARGDRERTRRGGRRSAVIDRWSGRITRIAGRRLVHLPIVRRRGGLVESRISTFVGVRQSRILLGQIEAPVGGATFDHDQGHRDGGGPIQLRTHGLAHPFLPVAIMRTIAADRLLREELVQEQQVGRVGVGIAKSF